MTITIMPLFVRHMLYIWLNYSTAMTVRFCSASRISYLLDTQQH